MGWSRNSYPYVFFRYDNLKHAKRCITMSARKNLGEKKNHTKKLNQSKIESKTFTKRCWIISHDATWKTLHMMDPWQRNPLQGSCSIWGVGGWRSPQDWSVKCGGDTLTPRFIKQKRSITSEFHQILSKQNIVYFLVMLRDSDTVSLVTDKSRNKMK